MARQMARCICSSFARLSSLLLVVLALGCMGQTRAARLQEAAQEMNLATRFGRMDVALAHISSSALQQFAERHNGWGNNVRIVDLECQGMQFLEKDQAIVFVAVGWQKMDEQELRVTHITQKWQYESNGWKLKDESRSGGALGLLGEPSVEAYPTRADAHYPSISIGSVE